MFDFAILFPSLLNGLDNEAHYGASIEGLRVILSVRPTTFNGVAPKLLKPPVTGAALRALGELAGVAGACVGGLLVSCLSSWFARGLLACRLARDEPTLQQSERCSLAEHRLQKTSRNSLMPRYACAVP